MYKTLQRKWTKNSSKK